MGNTLDLQKLGILDMLAAVLADKLPENAGSTQKRKDGEVEQGIVTSPNARSLYTAYIATAEYLESAEKAHSEWHEQSPGPKLEDCYKHHMEQARLSARKDLLHPLYWQAIAEQYPEVSVNNAALREGWMLVNEEGREWNKTVLISDPYNIARKFINLLSQIVTGVYPGPVTEVDLAPVGHDEEVVGIITDQRIKDIWGFMYTIRNGLKANIPSDLLKVEEGETMINEAAVGKISVDEARRLQLLSHLFKRLHDSAVEIFTTAVRESVPDTDGCLRVRKGWKVTKLPEESRSAGLEIVMTSSGPAFRIRIPIRPSRES